MTCMIYLSTQALPWQDYIYKINFKMERGTKTQEKQKLGGLKFAFENGGPILHIFENRGVKSIFKSKMYY